jgi:hypothetical protein
MADSAQEPEDAVARAARHSAERRDQQRATANAAREAQAQHESSGDEALNRRKLVFGLVIVALLAASGCFLLMQMRCDQYYSNISGFLFDQCR